MRRAQQQVDKLSLEERARLTTWLIDHRPRNDKQTPRVDDLPEITESVVGQVKTMRPLLAYERADRLLRFIAEQSNAVGTPYHIRGEDPAVYAWSESIAKGEVGHLVQYLMTEGWIESKPQTRSAPIRGL